MDLPVGGLFGRTRDPRTGLNKLIVNYLDKLFVTSDASTIMRELEVQHPAAKLVVMAANMQEAEVTTVSAAVSHGRSRSGTAATTLCCLPVHSWSTLVGPCALCFLALLSQRASPLSYHLAVIAVELLKMGLHQSDIISGFNLAFAKSQEIMEGAYSLSSSTREMDRVVITCLDFLVCPSRAG